MPLYVPVRETYVGPFKSRPIDGTSIESAVPPVACTDYLTGIYAAIPAAGSAGRIYLPSDGFAVYYDNGATWDAWGPVYGQGTAVASDFAWINQGGATVDETYGGMYLHAPAGAANNVRILKKAAPSTPYTITAAFANNMARYADLSFGLLWRQSSDGKLAILRMRGSAHSVSGIESVKYTDPATGLATYVSLPVALMPNSIWLRIEDDGVDRICSLSYDGHYWYEVHSVARTDFITADEVGFCAETANATYSIGVNVMSWEES